ncbi:MAG TPA: hypothetical protein VIG99_07155 [Myxococcaceae bacterium]|jgi:hypothetical protein
MLVPCALLLALLAAEPPAHGVSLGIGTVSYVSIFSGSPWRPGLDLAYERDLSPRWLLRAGLRAALPSQRTPVPGELYAQLQLRAVLGVWEPAIGPELGVSGLTDLGALPDSLPPELNDLEQLRVSPLYVAIAAAPLRFRLGRFTLSALELHWGTTLVPPGAAVRFHLGFIRVSAGLPP